MMMSSRRWCFCGLAAAALACSSNAARPPAGPADAGSLDAADPAAVIGAFDIRLVAADPGTATSPPVPAFVAIQGRVSNAPRPPLLTLDITAREGDCLVEIPSPPFCESCLEGTCVKGGKCVPNPQPRSVGTVTITGLATIAGSAPVSMAPEPPQYFYQPNNDVKIAFPPFIEGAAVGLTASGGDLGGFEITSKGTTLLEVTSATPLTMAKGKPLALRWRAAAVAGISRVAIAVDISHHGGFKGQISCDVPDSGSFDIPASFVDKLINLGVAGYPTITVTRRTTGRAQLPAGRVELNVIAERIIPLVIPGFVSCSEDEPCPGGKTCGQNGLCP